MGPTGARRRCLGLRCGVGAAPGSESGDSRRRVPGPHPAHAPARGAFAQCWLRWSRSSPGGAVALGVRRSVSRRPRSRSRAAARSARSRARAGRERAGVAFAGREGERARAHGGLHAAAKLPGPTAPAVGLPQGAARNASCASCSRRARRAIPSGGAAARDGAAPHADVCWSACERTVRRPHASPSAAVGQRRSGRARAASPPAWHGRARAHGSGAGCARAIARPGAGAT